MPLLVAAGPGESHRRSNIPAATPPAAYAVAVSDCGALHYCNDCERLYEAAEGHVWCPECRAEVG